jgi:hypothetical protein
MVTKKKAEVAVKPANTPAVKDPDAVDAGLDAYLRASAIVDSINKNLPKGANLPAIPETYVFRKRDRETVSVALHSAFELVGGVPSLINWAATNPKDFYALWSRLLPSNTETPVGGTTINFVSPIPQNPLDLVNVDAAGKVMTIEAAPDLDLPE